MGLIRIFCHNCRRSWDVYGRGVKDADANQCPYCGAEIDRQTWDKFILPAWGWMEDANRELEKDHTGMDYPIFHVNFLGKKAR